MGVVIDMKAFFAVAIALALCASVSADPTAAKTLKLMVAGIKAGSFDNNFFTGHFLQAASAKNVQSEVGSCLLDKAGAIKNEDGLAKFPNDLKGDLAACCTKGGAAAEAQGIKDVNPAYEALTQQTDGNSGQTAKQLSAKALKSIVSAASSRLKGANLVPRAAQLLKSVEVDTVWTDTKEFEKEEY